MVDEELRKSKQILANLLIESCKEQWFSDPITNLYTVSIVDIV